jgi:hypothetical protein
VCAPQAESRQCRLLARSNLRSRRRLGLRDLRHGSPTAQQIHCSTRAPVGAAAAATGSLAYNASTGRYTFSWKTQKAWARTCRQLTLGLRDGTSRTVYARLVK